MKELAYLNKYFYKYRWRFLLGVIFVIISNYFRVLQPQIIRYALDLVVENISVYDLYEGFDGQAVLGEKIGYYLLFFGGLTIAFALLMGFFMYFMRQTLIVMSRLIEYDLRSEIFAHYERLTLSFYKRNNTGDLMSRITEDVSKVRMYLGPAVMYAINLTILCVLVIRAMILVSPELTMYTLIPLPILSFSIYYVTSIINKKNELIQRQLATLNSLSQEVYSGIRVVKSYTQEQAMTNFFEEECGTFMDRNMDLAKIQAAFRPLMLILVGASTIITIFVGGNLVLAGDISPGNIAEFIIYINLLTWPVTSIGWVASIVQAAAASQKRINEFLKIQPDFEANTKEEASVEGDIHFEQVSFTYPDTGIEALKDVSFSLKKGQKMAILGRTGSGKTTIADLLVRMYECTEGSIQINGKNINEHNLSTLRERVAYVPQDVFLFSDTIENNISFAKEEASLEQVKEYADYASIHQDIMGLPKNYQTMVGERGVTLSGGQKQRISIARALIKDPEFILLDDCLSAVDAKTEHRISSYLKDICADKTTIIITHRMYSNIDFDEIIVLDEGRIAERGTHEELLANGGYYAEIYEQQMENIE